MTSDAFIEEAIYFDVTHLLKASFSSGRGGRMAEVCAASVATCLDQTRCHTTQAALKWVSLCEYRKGPHVRSLRTFKVGVCFLGRFTPYTAGVGCCIRFVSQKDFGNVRKTVLQRFNMAFMLYNLKKD